MGMHHGMVAAAVASADQMIAALNAYLPVLAPGATRGSFDDLTLEDDDDGWHMAFGQHAGRSYILDTSFVLSSDGDALVAASRDLGCVVIGCGAETTSGSYWLYVADQGRLVRGYWNCYSDMQAPWSKGELLASESSQPLEDLDGAGLMAVLTTFGFDYDGWAGGADLQALTYNPDAEAPTQPGTLAVELGEFRKSVEIPEGKQPKPKVVRRGDGFDLAVSPPSEKKKGGLFGFLRRG